MCHPFRPQRNSEAKPGKRARSAVQNSGNEREPSRGIIRFIMIIIIIVIGTPRRRRFHASFCTVARNKEKNPDRNKTKERRVSDKNSRTFFGPRKKHICYVARCLSFPRTKPDFDTLKPQTAERER